MGLWDSELHKLYRGREETDEGRGRERDSERSSVRNNRTRTEVLSLIHHVSKLIQRQKPAAHCVLGAAALLPFSLSVCVFWSCFKPHDGHQQSGTGEFRLGVDENEKRSRIQKQEESNPTITATINVTLWFDHV